MTDPSLEKAHVDIVNLRHSWGDRVVYDGLSCRFVEGKITVILGASGGGKTTLMRMIACLGPPDFGDIWVGDQEITCMTRLPWQRVNRAIQDALALVTLAELAGAPGGERTGPAPVAGGVAAKH